MRSGNHSRVSAFGAAVTMAMVLASSVPGHAQRGSIFAGLAGQWGGEGRISMSDGSTERIRCRALYSVSPTGANLHQDLRCASESYRLDITSRIVDEGGTIEGTWSEASH